MPWDSDKQNFTERSEVGESEKLSAAEWNAHVTDQKDHSARHESGGIDEITVEGLSGDLADPQDPKQAVVNDFVDTLVDGGDKVTTTYDSGAGTLTIDTSALDTEEVEDAVAALVTAGNAITVNYDDVNDSLSIGVDESALSFYDGTNLTAPVDNESVSTESLFTDDNHRVIDHFDRVGDSVEFNLPQADKITFEFYELRRSADSGPLNLQFSDDGGETWITGNSFVRREIRSDGLDSSEENNSSDGIVLLHELTGDFNRERNPAILQMGALRDGNRYTTIHFSGGFTGASASAIYCETVGVPGSTAVYDTLRFTTMDNDDVRMKGHVKTLPGGD